MNTASLAETPLINSLLDRNWVRNTLGHLPEPSDFFPKVLNSEQTAPPANILCFQRVSGRQLAVVDRALFHHHRHVLIFNLGKSNGKIFVDNEVVTLGEGRALLIQSFQFHHYAVPPGRKICWLFVTFELRNCYECQTRQVSFGEEDGSEFILKQFLESYLASEGADFGQIECSAFFLGALLSRLYRKSRLAADPLPQQLHSGIFSRIRTKVMADPAIKIKKLSAALGISESTLRRQFREASMGCLGSYLRELRFHIALQDLRCNEMNLTEIGFRAGYDSLQAFSRAFKSRTGFSPRAYRKHIADFALD